MSEIEVFPLRDVCNIFYPHKMQFVLAIEAE